MNQQERNEMTSLRDALRTIEKAGGKNAAMDKKYMLDQISRRRSEIQATLEDSSGKKIISEQ